MAQSGRGGIGSRKGGLSPKEKKKHSRQDKHCGRASLLYHLNLKDSIVVFRECID
jgi:hypothetical protein